MGINPDVPQDLANLLAGLGTYAIPKEITISALNPKEIASPHEDHILLHVRYSVVTQNSESEDEVMDFVFKRNQFDAVAQLMDRSVDSIDETFSYFLDLEDEPPHPA